MNLTLQVGFSILLVVAVFFFMWRMPNKGEAFYPYAPPMALASAWTGLLATIISALLWLLPYPDYWLWGTLWLLDPAAICLGCLVLWIYRDEVHLNDTINAQQLQSKVGVTLGLIGATLGYTFVMLRTPMPPQM